MKKQLKIAISTLLLICYLASPVSVLAAVASTSVLDNGN